MKRSELIEQIEAHLITKQQVSDEAAPGIKLLRLAFAELKQPANTDTESAALNEELRSADQTIAAQNDKISEYSDVLYELLLQAGLLPEIDGEPVLTFEMALKEDPSCIEKLTNSFGGYNDNHEQTDSDRFISGVYNLLGIGPNVSLEGLFSHLEGKAQYLASLESGIAQRDQLLAQADNQNGIAPHPLWVQDAIDLAHAVRGDLSPENRIMAKAADKIILHAPKGEI